MADIPPGHTDLPGPSPFTELANKKTQHIHWCVDGTGGFCELGQKRGMEASKGPIWVLSSAQPLVLKPKHESGDLVVLVASSLGGAVSELCSIVLLLQIF